jgi:hypothetical protein
MKTAYILTCKYRGRLFEVHCRTKAAARQALKWGIGRAQILQVRPA